MTDSGRMQNGSSANTEQQESRYLQHDATLIVDEHVSLTLGSDSLVIVGTSTLSRLAGGGRSK